MRSGMDIAFFGSSLVSAYWNGAATYYRGIIRALHSRGHRVTFYEPNAYGRQEHRDMADPDWARVVVYSGETVTFNGVTEIPAEQYVQQATDIATVGVEAKPDPKMGEWQPLGVFAMVGEGEEKSTNIFQLAINKEGVISGEYYNALTDTTEPVYGSVDAKTQRAAWTVATRKFPVYEAGIANLTKDETTMLVHFGEGKSQQLTLVRVEKPEGEGSPNGQ